MRLVTLIDSIKQYTLASSVMGPDFKVQGISADSKKVGKGYMFAGIKGTREDGTKFVREAITRGAGAILIQGRLRYPGGIPAGITVLETNDARGALARLAAAWYGHPSSKLNVVGVTGTNGKTTVTYLIEAILKRARRECGVIGTVNYRFGRTSLRAKNTTPGPLELESLLSRMVKAKMRYAVMEVSSHSQDQERTGAVRFHSAIFTNLTQDHLDYHGTIQKYFEAKSKLFSRLSPDAFCILNNDDPFGRRLKRLTRARIVTYGIDSKADYVASKVRLDESGTRFTLRCPAGGVPYAMELIGRHNVYNVLAAASWALEEGIAMGAVVSAVQQFGGAPGRLQKIKSAKGFSVFVDYAHTDDALTNVLRSLRQLGPRSIIVVFGCGGDRDRGKRPKMGRVATALADQVIVTSDNPRSEDPQTIINDITRGIRKRNFSVIPDRRKAIRKALSTARRGDIVLIAGKGHENYQIVGETVTHFDDREVVRTCLKSMN